MKKTLKTLKKEVSEYLDNDDSQSAIAICYEIIDNYPKNKYGYLELIKIKTNDYNDYINEDELSKLKSIYDKVMLVLNDEEIEKLKKDFNTYIGDLKEVEHLKKIKKDIVSNELLKVLYNNLIARINENTLLSKKYNLSGKRITNGYDFIKGLFYIICLIYNLFNINKMLFITVPFGIFGIIIIYSFISMNFFGKEKLLSEKIIFKNKIKKVEDKIKALKKEISKKDNTIISLKKNKKDNVLNIPKDFHLSIKELIDDNEEKIANEIADSFYSKNIALFTYLINENTSLYVDDLIKMYEKENDDILSLQDLISKKEENKKNNQNMLMLIQKLKPFNYIITLFLMVISLFSLIVIIRSFSDLDFRSFIVGLIVGILTMLIYNIVSGKHNNFSETINDNLLSTIFNAALVYDLVYYATYNKLPFWYGFFKIPVIYILLLIGPVAIISMLKYKNLINRLRK